MLRLGYRDRYTACTNGILILTHVSKSANTILKLYLLKSFHFRNREVLPYRSDGRGGNVFHGVGSHVLFSDLRHRRYDFAFEVASYHQSTENHLKRARVRAELNGDSVEIEHNILEFSPEARRPTLNPEISSFQWIQYLNIDIKQPALVELYIEMQFTDTDDWLPVEGCTRVLVDLHPGQPPKYYNKLVWHFRRLIGKTN